MLIHKETPARKSPLPGAYLLRCYLDKRERKPGLTGVAEWRCGGVFAHIPFDPARQARLCLTREEPKAQGDDFTCLRSCSRWRPERDSDLDLDPKPMSSTPWRLCCAAHCVVRRLFCNPAREGKSRRAWSLVRNLRFSSGSRCIFTTPWDRPVLL